MPDRETPNAAKLQLLRAARQVAKVRLGRPGSPRT